jgi:hypothetical protein
VIGIVKLALHRPYTFIVMALLIMIFGVASALRKTRGERPNGSGAAEKRYELASPHCLVLGSTTAAYHIVGGRSVVRHGKMGCSCPLWVNRHLGVPGNVRRQLVSYGRGNHAMSSMRMITLSV